MIIQMQFKILVIIVKDLIINIFNGNCIQIKLWILQLVMIPQQLCHPVRIKLYVCGITNRNN